MDEKIFKKFIEELETLIIEEDEDCYGCVVIREKLKDTLIDFNNITGVGKLE